MTLLILIAVALLGAAPSQAMVLPEGFVEEPVANVPAPTALTFLPDGRKLVSSQNGQLWVVRADDSVVPTPAMDISTRICTGSERGLTGLETAPDFALTGHIYAYYTAMGAGGGCAGYGAGKAVNRLSRFTMVGNVVNTTSEQIILDNIPSPLGIHNAGDVHVAKDGKLYVSIGDGGCKYSDRNYCGGYNNASRITSVVSGKILRLNVDGSIPADNPYAATGQRCALIGVGDPAKPCAELFAIGLRNPFRMAFDPNAAGARFYINDVGWNVWEEVNEGKLGGDYGWNAREGKCNVATRTNCTPRASDPIYAYDHRTGCAAVTGGAFVPNGLWGTNDDNSYLFADYVCGKIFQMKKVGTEYVVTDFATDLGSSSATNLKFGPSPSGPALYLTSYAEGGALHRIRYVGAGNRRPSASATATPSSGSLPLNVSFDASASKDPDGDPITYQWDFGDGATATTTTPKTTHVYTTAAKRTVTLRTKDDEGLLSIAFTLSVDAGNNPPVPVIDTPVAGTSFGAGETITLKAHASDIEDVALPGTSLHWEVRRHHGTHYHPWFTGTGATATILGPEPEDIAAADNSYLEIRLTATDSNGVSTLVTRSIQPAKRKLTVATQPTGLTVGLNNELTAAAPQTITSWRGSSVSLVTAPRQLIGTNVFDFLNWSDGGAASHIYKMPDADTTLTAKFNQAAPGTTGLRGEYYDNEDFTERRVVRVDPSVAFRWGSGAPDPSIGADSWSARWTGSLQVPQSGTWKLYGAAQTGLTVKLDGKEVLAKWTYNAFTPEKIVSLPLTAGLHDIVVEYHDHAGASMIQLAWQGPGIDGKQIVGPGYLTPPAGVPAPTAKLAATPLNGDAPLKVNFDATGSSQLGGGALSYLWDFGDGSAPQTTTTPTVSHTYAVGSWTATLRVKGTAGPISDPVTKAIKVIAPPPPGSAGLRGEYFDNEDFTASKLVRIDPALAFRWGSGSPDPLIGADTWSTRWTGKLRVPTTGVWKLFISGDDGGTIFLDGKQVLTKWSYSIWVPEKSGTITLAAGEHDLRVDYHEHVTGASFQVAWSGPGVPTKTPLGPPYLVH